jgi:hypothetical protein
MTEVVSRLPAILRPYYLAEAIGVAKAARQAGKSERTMREWCARHRIGRMIGGRWAISQIALDMLLEGDKDGLEAYLNGDRNSERVRSYYTRRSIPLQTDHAASADYADTGGGRR